MKHLALTILISLSGCNWFTLNCPSHTPGTPPVCTVTGG